MLDWGSQQISIPDGYGTPSDFHEHERQLKIMIEIYSSCLWPESFFLYEAVQLSD